MILTKIFIVLAVLIAIITEIYSTKYKNDPYKAQIKLLKAARKAEKYRQKAQKWEQKYALRPQHRPLTFEGSSYESGESSSEEWSYPFGGGFPSSYPPQNNNRPNRPGVVESSASASSGGNGGGSGSNGGNNNNNNGGSNNGGGGGQYPILQPGDNGNRLPFNPSEGGNAGAIRDPLQQLNQGLNGFLQGLGSITLGQLLGGGGFRFPNQ